eukprot:m.103804 g.103804  ORF g.103804 m.103804 type:complete len:98 (+) comp10497_c0_seq2:874-1167(+)
MNATLQAPRHVCMSLLAIKNVWPYNMHCFVTGTAQGTFVPDKTKALEYSSKACGMGHPWACANASRMCKIGDGVPVDMDQAAAFKEQYMRIKRGELS